MSSGLGSRQLVRPSQTLQILAAARCTAGSGEVSRAWYAQEIAALLRRDVRLELAPGLGEDPARALLIEPADLLRADQEDAAQHQLRHPLRMRLGVGQREMPRCSRSSSMSLTRSQVVFSSRLAKGVLRPQPRWSKSTMR